MRSPLARFLAAASVTLALVGCTAGGATDEGESSAAPQSPSASVEVTPEPTTTEDPDAVPAEPEAAFLGDCTQVLTEEDLEAIAPVAWTVTDLPGDPATTLAGVLSCRWSAGPDGDVSVDVVPLSLVTDEALATPDIVTCPETEGPELCMAELAVGDSWLIAGARDEDALSAVVGRVGARLIGQHPVAAPLPPGSWALPDCALVLEAARAAGMPEAEPGVQNDSRPYGPLWDALAADGRAGWCAAHQPEEGGIAVTLYPGGADRGPVPDGEELDVDGADRGWIEIEDDGLSTGIVDAGVNRLAFATSGFLQDREELLGEILATLTERTDL